MSLTTLSDMKDLCFLIWHALALVVNLIKPGSVKALAAENLLLKQQLIVINRDRKRAPKLITTDKLIFAFCASFMNKSRLQKAAIILKPRTLLKFHKTLVNRKYRSLFSSSPKTRPGPKGPSQELIKAIVELKQLNPRFGCPRIAQQINLAFGTDIDKDVVRRVLEHYYKPTSNDDGPSWLSFLGHCKDSVWSIDLFRCESINLTSYWVLLIMDIHSRRMVGFGTTRGEMDGTTLCRVFRQATKGSQHPKYLSSDNDPLFRFYRWQANLRILDIQEVKSVPFTPISHPYVERLIGTIRREFLDQTSFCNQLDLERKLSSFQTYYNEHRTHSGNKASPPVELTQKTASLDSFQWKRHSRGLFTLPDLALD